MSPAVMALRGEAGQLISSSPTGQNTPDNGDFTSTKRPKGIAVSTAVLVYLCAIADGYDIGVFGTVLVRLQEVYRLRPRILGLLGASVFIGSLSGAFGAGPLADWLGRKKCFSVACVFLFSGVFMMMLAPGVPFLIAGRAIMGVGFGISLPLGSLYIVEIAPADIRGTIGAAFGGCLALGIAIGNIAGSLLQDTWRDWQVMLFLGAVVPVPVGIGFLSPYFPESPRWFALQNRGEEARQTLHRLMTDEDLIAKTLQDLLKEASISGDEATHFRNVLYPSAANRPRVVASIGVAVSSYACGSIALAIYWPVVLTPLLGRRVAVIATGITSVASSLIGLACSHLSENFGQRRILLVGYALHMFMLVLLALVASPWGLESAPFQGLWFASVWAICCCTYAAAIGPVSQVYICEILPLDCRARGTGIGNACGRCVCFLLAICLPSLMHMSTWMTLGGLGLINALICIFIYDTVLETKGLELEDISKIYDAKA